MSEKKLGTQINDLYLEFMAGNITRRDLAKGVAALGIPAIAVSTFMRGVPAYAQDATPVASPAATYEPFTSMTREEWKAVLMGWWAEQDPPYSEPTTAGGQVIMGELASSFVSTTNLMLGSDNPTNPVLGLVYETLVATSPIDGQYVPGGLADYWTIDADGKTYTFYLNPNVMWHDGTPLTADDVVFSMDAQSNELTGSSYTASFNGFVASYEAVDTTTVKVVATDVYAQVVFHGNSYVPIVPKHIWESVPFENWASDPGSTGEDMSRVIGSGPFKMTEYSPSNNRVAFVKNDAHWDQVPVVDEFVFSASQDEVAALEQLRVGDIDFYESPPAAEIENLEAEDNLTVALYPTYNFSFYGTNLDPEKTTLFQDVRTRQGMLRAIDRQSIIDNILLGYGTVANGSQPELSPAFAPDRITNVYSYDVEAAKALLAEAGWVDADGDGILELDGQKLSFEVMYGSGSPTSDQIVAAFQEMWAAVGIEAIPLPVDFGGVLVPALTETFDYVVCFLGFIWDPTGDQSPMFATSSYGAGFNFMKYSNPEVDALFEAAAVELDEAARTEMQIQINDLINNDLPIAVVWFPQGRTGYNVRLNNFVPNAPGGLLWTMPFVYVVD